MQADGPDGDLWRDGSQAVQLGFAHVGHQVAEVVDVDHLAAERARLAHRAGELEALQVPHLGAQALGRCAGSQGGGDRREHVASVEGGAARGEEEALLGQVNDVLNLRAGSGE